MNARLLSIRSTSCPDMRNDRIFPLRQNVHHLRVWPAMCDSMFLEGIDRAVLPSKTMYQVAVKAMEGNNVAVPKKKLFS